MTKEFDFDEEMKRLQDFDEDEYPNFDEEKYPEYLQDEEEYPNFDDGPFPSDPDTRAIPVPIPFGDLKLQIKALAKKSCIAANLMGVDDDIHPCGEEDDEEV